MTSAEKYSYFHHTRNNDWYRVNNETGVVTVKAMWLWLPTLFTASDLHDSGHFTPVTPTEFEAPR